MEEAKKYGPYVAAGLVAAGVGLYIYHSMGKEQEAEKVARKNEKKMK